MNENTLGCIFGILLIAVFSLMGNWVIWQLYTFIMVVKFHWPYLTYWETYGLMFLISVVSGRFKATVGKK